MNKTRFPILIVVVSLLIVAMLSFWTFQRTVVAGDTSSTKLLGIGDLHNFEAQQQMIPVTSSNGNLSATAGKGDLLYLEAQRWEALGEYYQALNAENFQHARAADLARWVAMGIYYSNR